MKKSTLFRLVYFIFIMVFIFPRFASAEDALFVDENGYVGIGTSNPLEKLEIDDGSIAFKYSSNPENERLLYFMRTTTGNGSTGYKFSWRNDDESYRKSVIEMDRNGDVYFPSGNVGIGTGSPDAKLNIQSGSDVSLSSAGYLVLGDLSSYNIGMDNNEIMARNSENNATLHIQNDGGSTHFGGNVGIGASSPGYSLQVYETDSNVAVWGKNTYESTTAYNYGVYGWSAGGGTNNVGVKGIADGPGTTNFGIVGYAGNATTNWAGWFSGNVYVTGIMDAGSFYDHTPFFEGDALSEIAKISGKNGEIDHSTLPEFAHFEGEVPVYEEKELVEISTNEAFETIKINIDKVVEKEDENGNILKSKIPNGTKIISKGYEVENGKVKEIIEEVPIYETELVEKKQLRKDVYFSSKTGKLYKKVGDGEVYEKDGKIFQENQIGTRIEEKRDIGAMVSILTVAVQQLDEQNKLLKNELCKKDKTYSFCKSKF